MRDDREWSSSQPCPDGMVHLQCASKYVAMHDVSSNVYEIKTTYVEASGRSVMQLKNKNEHSRARMGSPVYFHADTWPSIRRLLRVYRNGEPSRLKRRAVFGAGQENVYRLNVEFFFLVFADEKRTDIIPLKTGNARPSHSPLERRCCIRGGVLSKDQRAPGVKRQKVGEIVHISVDDDDATLSSLRQRRRIWRLLVAGQLFQEVSRFGAMGAKEGFTPRVTEASVIAACARTRVGGGWRFSCGLIRGARATAGAAVAAAGGRRRRQSRCSLCNCLVLLAAAVLNIVPMTACAGPT